MKRIVLGVLATMCLGGAMSHAQITVKGDIRYRYESIDDSTKTDVRDRERIRARLSASGKANDQLSGEIQFSTGGTDPVSGNQTIGDAFDKKDMMLAMAYLNYKFSDQVSAVAGKMKNPFMTQSEDLVWDSDLAPEGIALRSEFGGDRTTVFANGGYLWVQERSGESDDSMLYAGQVGVKMQFIPEFCMTLGGSYYGFQEIQGRDVLEGSSFGNSTIHGTVSGSTTNKAWKYEFIPVVFFAQIDAFVAEIPVSIFGQVLSNGEAGSNDAGLMYGLSIGKAKNPKTWEIGYSHAKLEKDATLGVFTDSDRWGGGADGEGDRVYGKYQIAKNLQAGVTYLMGEKKISSSSPTDYNRLQVDIAASF